MRGSAAGHVERGWSVMHAPIGMQGPAPARTQKTFADRPRSGSGHNRGHADSTPLI